jgi:hypothetical protein
MSEISIVTLGQAVIATAAAIVIVFAWGMYRDVRRGR